MRGDSEVRIWKGSTGDCMKLTQVMQLHFGGPGSGRHPEGDKFRITNDNRHTSNKVHSTWYDNTAKHTVRETPRTTSGKISYEIGVTHNRSTGAVTITPVRTTRAGGNQGKEVEFNKIQDAAKYLKDNYGISHTFKG